MKATPRTDPGSHGTRVIQEPVSCLDDMAGESNRGRVGSFLTSPHWVRVDLPASTFTAQGNIVLKNITSRKTGEGRNSKEREVERIDQELTLRAEDVAKYGREVLRRLISVIVFISERGIAF
ncbi:hypothetical protein PR048_006716 [Dryococelus australis]|uniref:Uncharacterized protein n=1 Tax=Dryococelus australis TaxID=614101 RepID=A0ABQ9IBT6_9NEOP|nr:hypothetical protein PR048_006716 [Dryococelus australis]